MATQPRSRKDTFLLLYTFLTLLMGIALIHSIQQKHKCQATGGHYVRGLLAMECVQ